MMNCMFIPPLEQTFPIWVSAARGLPAVWLLFRGGSGTAAQAANAANL